MNETQIAKEIMQKIEVFDNWYLKRYLKFEDDIEILKSKSVDYQILKAKTINHKKTCERFLNSLEEIFGWLAVCNKDENVLRLAKIIKEKIKDLQEAINIYSPQEEVKGWSLSLSPQGELIPADKL